MGLIENKVKECFDGKIKERLTDDVKRIIIHRIDIGETAEEVCKKFQEVEEVSKYTGKQNPYTFFIRRDGTIEQACPLIEITAHARRFNKQGIGVGVIGDFRKHKPTNQQIEALIYLCAILVTWKRKLIVSGHDELFGATNDPNKECPGKYLNVHELRLEIKKKIEYNNEKRLTESGISIYS